MDPDWDEEYEEGEEYFYDDDGAFGVGVLPRPGFLHGEGTASI